MKCKVIVAFGTYRVGDIIEPTGVYRDSLKARKLIEIVEDRTAPLVECAVAVEPETAAAPAPKRRKRTK